MLNSSKNISVVISGGLGNQMFQYASALAIAKYHESQLILDLSWFDVVDSLMDTTSRKYSLDIFGIRNEIKNKFYSPISVAWPSRIRRRILRSIPGLVKSNEVLTEANFAFNEDVFKIPPPFLLNGYWQSEKYFIKIAKEVSDIFGCKTALSVNSQLLMNQILQADSICVHIRRGDYVSNKAASNFHGICGIDYYHKGISFISRSLLNPHCFIFSDDIEWSRENLKLEIPITFVDINGPDQAHQDLWLMASCKHFVIANSSFSWWGAWLGRDPRKIVVSPKKWFVDDKLGSEDRYPASWLRF